MCRFNMEKFWTLSVWSSLSVSYSRSTLGCGSLGRTQGTQWEGSRRTERLHSSSFHMKSLYVMLHLSGVNKTLMRLLKIHTQVCVEIPVAPLKGISWYHKKELLTRFVLIWLNLRVINSPQINVCKLFALCAKQECIKLWMNAMRSADPVLQMTALKDVVSCFAINQKRSWRWALVREEQR